MRDPPTRIPYAPPALVRDSCATPLGVLMRDPPTRLRYAPPSLVRDYCVLMRDPPRRIRYAPPALVSAHVSTTARLVLCGAKHLPYAHARLVQAGSMQMLVYIGPCVDHCVCSRATPLRASPTRLRRAAAPGAWPHPAVGLYWACVKRVCVPAGPHLPARGLGQCARMRSVVLVGSPTTYSTVVLSHEHNTSRACGRPLCAVCFASRAHARRLCAHERLPYAHARVLCGATRRPVNAPVVSVRAGERARVRKGAVGGVQAHQLLRRGRRAPHAARALPGQVSTMLSHFALWLYSLTILSHYTL
jgi:hypothetical protein